MRQLSGVDAYHALAESPRQHMHTIKIAVIDPGAADRPISLPTLRAWSADRLVHIPALRWRLVKIPLGLGRPVFVDGGPLDVDYHVVAERLPPPGTPEQFDDLVSRIASQQLDRARPLWQLTLVEGMAQGQLGLVFKLHHSIMDGQASVRFLETAFDGAGAAPSGPAPAAEPIPSTARLVRFALASHLRLAAALPTVLRRTVASVRDNEARKKSGAARVVNPLSGPRTRLNAPVTAERIYVDVTIPLRELRAIKDAAGATLNDVFVALCGGAIRRYLEEHGEVPDRCLNATAPVSLRGEHERDSFGNRTSYWYVSLGTDTPDPLERLAKVQASIGAARAWAEGDVELFAVWQDYYTLFGLLTLRTLTLIERLTGRPAFNAIVSNVRGPQPLSLFGAPVVAIRSMGPVTRTLGLNMTGWSYRDDFSVGLHACRDTSPDLRRLAEHVRAELDAFARAAGVTASHPGVATA